MLAEEDGSDAEGETATEVVAEPETPQYAEPPARQYALGDLLQVKRV